MSRKNLFNAKAPTPPWMALVDNVGNILSRRKGLLGGCFAATMLTVMLHGCDGTPPDEPSVAALREAGRLSDAVELRFWQSESSGWEGVPATTLPLHPQSAIEPGLDAGAPVTARLQARSDDARLLLRIEWPDTSEDIYDMNSTDRFADALAVQFNTDEGRTLPYIGMGEPQRSVQLWFWRAGRDVEALTARGFGTLKTDGSATAPAIEAERTANGWAVTFVGPRPASSNPLPLSIAVWDGADAGRDGRKRLSAWHLLRLPGNAPDPKHTEALAEEARNGGNAQNGARLVQQHGCTACHRLPGQTPPSTELGPDLTNAGALHWPGYLRRAISKPSAFILPLAEYRAPGTEAAPISLMPALELQTNEIEDLVAYLSSPPDSAH